MHFPNLRSHGVEPYDWIEHCPLLMSVALEVIQLDQKSSSRRCAHPDCSRITGNPEVTGLGKSCRQSKSYLSWQFPVLPTRSRHALTSRAASSNAIITLR